MPGGRCQREGGEGADRAARRRFLADRRPQPDEEPARIAASHAGPHVRALELRLEPVTVTRARPIRIEVERETEVAR